MSLSKLYLQKDLTFSIGDMGISLEIALIFLLNFPIENNLKVKEESNGVDFSLAVLFLFVFKSMRLPVLLFRYI